MSTRIYRKEIKSIRASVGIDNDDSYGPDAAVFKCDGGSGYFLHRGERYKEIRDIAAPISTVSLSAPLKTYTEAETEKQEEAIEYFLNELCEW